MKKKTRSDYLQRIAKLLDAVNRYPHLSKSRQMAIANLNFTDSKGLFALLVSKGYIRCIGKRYHINNSGLDLLRQINQCYEALRVDRLEVMVIA